MQDIFSKLVDNSVTLGLLAIGLYFMWKENMAYRKKQDDELDQLKKEMHKYFVDDRALMQNVIEHNASAFEEFTKTNQKTNHILNCLIPELNSFKKSGVYFQYMQETKGNKQQQQQQH